MPKFLAARAKCRPPTPNPTMMRWSATQAWSAQLVSISRSKGRLASRANSGSPRTKSAARGERAMSGGVSAMVMMLAARNNW